MRIKSMVGHHGVVYLLSDLGKVYHFKIDERCFPEPTMGGLSESEVINEFKESEIEEKEKG